MTTFEEEQEANAIISYQELVDNVKAGKIDVIDDEETNINFVEALALSNDEPLMQISEEESESKVTPTMVKDAINEIIYGIPAVKFKDGNIISEQYVYDAFKNSCYELITAKCEICGKIKVFKVKK